MLTTHAHPVSPALGKAWLPRLVAITLCTGLVALTAPANAETVSDADKAGDMVTVTFDEEGEDIVAAPWRKRNDVTRTRLAHSARRIAVEVEYVDLAKKAGEIQVLDIAMKTNEGARRYLQVAAYAKHWSGETEMYDGQWRSLRCSVRHSIDYEADVVKVSFPRRCASNPRWVWFRVGSLVESDKGLFADDALRDRPLTADDETLRRSARVHRA